MAASASIARAASLHAQRLWFTLTTGAGPVLLAVSVVGWALLLLVAHRPSLPHQHHHHHGAAPGAGGPDALGWLLMLVAMMPLVLADPLEHLWTRSLNRTRVRLIALFLAAYGLVWMTAGWALVAAGARVLTLLAPAPYAALAAVGLAALWHVSPVKQRCLNRCHRLPTLAAFGRAADRDAVRYGLTTAGWCVGSCWALMLAPSVVAGAHVPLMAVAMVLMLADRQGPCRPLGWHWPFARR